MYREGVLRTVRSQRLLHDVTLELTYRCNLDCFFCYNDREKKGTPLTLDQYRVLLEDLARMQTMFLMLSGGEPMVHPHFFDIGRMTKEFGFVVRVRTNGHTLGPRNIERLQREVDPYVVEVSLHGATAEVHERQTRARGSFDRLIRNLRMAVDAGLRCRMVATPTAWNEHEIEAMAALGDDIGAPLRFQGPVAPRDNGDTAPLAIQPAGATWDRVGALIEARRARLGSDSDRSSGQEISVEREAETAATCSVGVAGVDIDPFGNVQACMHLQESAGNLHEQSIEEIWNHSPLFTRARGRAIEAAARFGDLPLQQLGAPLFCLAVEENAAKGCGSGAAGCGSCARP
jgi:MoaA/NifB/PqqE/SkfB family radical SAM enzyme